VVQHVPRPDVDDVVLGRDQPLRALAVREAGGLQPMFLYLLLQIERERQSTS
jgi:hypothetical protein